MSKKLTEADWRAIRYEFENSKISMRKLAAKYNTNAMAISRKAKEQQWVKFDPVAFAKGALESSKADAVKKHRALLTDMAIRKIEEIIEELGEHYTPVDEPLIVMYALQYQRAIKLEIEVQRSGETIISPKTGAEYLNPKFTALQSVKSSLAKLGDRLGLSIASRKRIGIRLGKKDDKTQSLFNLVETLNENSGALLDV